MNLANSFSPINSQKNTHCQCHTFYFPFKAGVSVSLKRASFADIAGASTAVEVHRSPAAQTVKRQSLLSHNFFSFFAFVKAVFFTLFFFALLVDRFLANRI